MITSNPAPKRSLWYYFWTCLTRKYVTFRGRARRREYWGYLLFDFLIQGIIILTTLAYTDIKMNMRYYLFMKMDEFLPKNIYGDFSRVGEALGMIFFLSALLFITLVTYNLLTLPAYFSVAIRRCHDRGMNSLWAIIPTIIFKLYPFLLVALLYFLVEGDPEFMPLDNTFLLLLGVNLYFFIQSCLDSKSESNRYGENLKHSESTPTPIPLPAVLYLLGVISFIIWLLTANDEFLIDILFHKTIT